MSYLLNRTSVKLIIHSLVEQVGKTLRGKEKKTNHKQQQQQQREYYGTKSRNMLLQAGMKLFAMTHITSFNHRFFFSRKKKVILQDNISTNNLVLMSEKPPKGEKTLLKDQMREGRGESFKLERSVHNDSSL